MRTTIDIDDRLMRRVLRLAGFATKKAAVEPGLRLLAEMHSQFSIHRLRGKVRCEGKLTVIATTKLEE